MENKYWSWEQKKAQISLNCKNLMTIWCFLWISQHEPPSYSCALVRRGCGSWFCSLFLLPSLLLFAGDHCPLCSAGPGPLQWSFYFSIPGRGNGGIVKTRPAVYNGWSESDIGASNSLDFFCTISIFLNLREKKCWLQSCKYPLWSFMCFSEFFFSLRIIFIIHLMNVDIRFYFLLS